MLKLFKCTINKSSLSVFYSKQVHNTNLILLRHSSKQCSSGGKGKKDKPSGKGDQKQCTDKAKKQCSSEKGHEVNEVPRLAINGFGRIGRMVMRVATEHGCPLEIVAINDTSMTTEHMAYLLKYDSTHGRFVGEVEVDGKQLVVEGKPICTYSESDPKNIPWKDLRIDYVVESTGKFTTMKKAQGHLTSGARKVVITASSEDAPMYIVGGNLECYDPSHKVVSCTPCITTALAPLMKVVHENFEVEEALVTTVHSVTGSQRVVDTAVEKWKDGRGAYQNIIPTSSGAAKALVKVLPELEGKVDLITMRVPVPNVSVLDVTCRLKKEASLENIKSAFCEAVEGPMLGIMDVATDPVVSSDFNGSHYSCIFDPHSCMALNKKFVKLIAWYDNEYGYTCRVIDLIKFMHAEERSSA